MDIPLVSRPFAKTIVVLMMSLTVLGGCATTDPEKPFGHVKEDFTARTGMEINWQRTPEARENVSHRIHAMLQDRLTLEEAVAIGLTNNRRIQGVYQKLGVAQAGLAQSQLLDNPHIGFAYLGNSPGIYKLELEAVFNILSLFLMPLREALAQEQLIQAQHEVVSIVLTHVFEIQKAYFTTLALQQEYRLLERVVLSSEAAYQMAERMRAAGNITRLELLSRRALVDEDRLALSSASLAVMDSREYLNRLMGLWGKDVNWTVQGDLPSLPENELRLEKVEQRSIKSSVDLALAKSNLRVTARELGITNVTSFIPELGIGAAFEREEDGMWLGGPALALELPIFDPGYAKRSKARAILERQWEAFTATAVEVRSRARQAHRRLLVAREQVQYYEKSFLPLRKEITEQAQRRYNGMYLSVFELLMIKRMEIRASLGYVDVLRNYWLARIDMDEILAGKLPEDSKSISTVRTVSGRTVTSGDH